MTDLKPCPFCGGKARLGEINHLYSSYIIECRCGANSGRDSDQESLISTWNTRQLAIDWKPIALLTEDWLISQEEVLLFDSYTHVGSVTKQGFYGGVCVNTGDFENDQYFNDIKNRYTYFAKITPPKF